MDQEITSHLYIGASLREARESQKLTLENVASQLRLSDKQITALENEDFDSFGSAMLTRGFIKNYARLLKLDPEPLLEAHRASVPQDQEQSIAYRAGELVASESFGVSKAKVLVLIGVLVLGLLAWVIYHNMDSQDKPVQVELATTPADENPEVALPAADRVDDVSAANAVTEIQLPKADAVVETSPQALPVEPTKQEPTNSSALAPGMVRVKLVLTSASWIGIQDKNGKTIFSELAKAGTERYVDGLPPLKLHIGNVSGTQVVFNGEVVDLAPSTHNNIARITLGDR